MLAKKFCEDNIALSLEHGQACLLQFDCAGSESASWANGTKVSLFAHDGCAFTMSMHDFLSKYCAPDEVEQVKKRLEFTFSTDMPFQMEHRLYNSQTHSWIWVNSLGIAQITKDGRKRFYGLIHNIDVRKRYEILLGAGQALSHNLRLMIDAMPISCTFWDNNCQPVDCNQGALRLFKLKSKQEYLERFYELSPKVQPGGKNTQEALRENMREAQRVGYGKFEWMHQTTDGQAIPSEVTLVHVKGGEGGITVGYARDLRKMKAALAQIYQTQEELREARDLAEKSANAKSEFLANMSHEIRTPMNAILGMLHLLMQSELTPLQRDYLQKAEHSATLLLRVINDILDFSKIEAGKIEMESIDFNIEELPSGIRDIMSKKLIEKNLTLDIYIDPAVPRMLNGDPVRLEQVLLNLVSNAIKFTNNGGIRIHITRDKAPTGLVKLLFKVSDTGIGMSQNQVEKLFRPFSQADTSTTRKYGGTGLGLAISSSLVELMGGKIWCESSQNNGSTFYFYAFFELPKGEALGNEKKTLPPAAECSVCLGSLKVLLAEDNEINQVIATELLKMKGIRVDVASNGIEAIEAVHSNSYDAVLMDIQMPEMDGISATRKLREDPRFTALPIIAMTAHAMAGDKEHSLENGLNDHITKPIDPDLLYATLVKWCCPQPGETKTCKQPIAPSSQ